MQSYFAGYNNFDGKNGPESIKGTNLRQLRRDTQSGRLHPHEKNVGDDWGWILMASIANTNWVEVNPRHEEEEPKNEAA